VETSWITFAVDLKQMAASFWMELGEARSKCDHLTRVPMPPEYARELHRINLVRGVQATTAIEGNTLTEDEIALIFDHHAKPMSSNYREREVQNVLGAYNDVTDRLKLGDVPRLTPQLIKTFNQQVLDGLDLEDAIRPGHIRNHNVVVGPYKGPDADQCESLLSQMCDWLNGPSFASEGPLRIPIAIIRASLAHLYLAWIHPFGDGNGRTARLCEFLVLVTSGVPTSAAHLISNHCNKTRDQYYAELRYASESGGDVKRFLTYCAEGFVNGLREQLEWVYDRQLRLAWREYVGQKVPGRDPDVRARRTLVAETMFDKDVTKESIVSLSPELARMYAITGARSGSRTIRKDVDELIEAGLLLQTKNGVRAKTEALLPLFPLAIPEER
jgi:Fic family protein